MNEDIVRELRIGVGAPVDMLFGQYDTASQAAERARVHQEEGNWHDWQGGVTERALGSFTITLYRSSSTD